MGMHEGLLFACSTWYANDQILCLSYSTKVSVLEMNKESFEN